jgi:preprotein translocase SecE subunit
VARDRNRSKQRRRKPGARGPSARSTDARAREIGFEPAGDVEQDSLPAAEKASPYVDEARMAEAGAEVPGDSGRRGDDVATDPAVLEDRRPGRKRGRVLSFLGHVVDELRRVQWPDRRQTGQGTAVTLGFVVIAGGFLGLMDAIWQPLIEAIL